MADDNQVLDPENKRKKYNTYADVEELLKGKVESEEERRARERREKSRQVINSIADVSRALGNMYNTSQYVQNAYDASKDSVSEAYQAKLDKAKAERDKNRDWWLNYALRMANTKASDRASEQAQQNWEAQMEAKQAAADQAQKNWEVEIELKKAAADQKQALTNAQAMYYEANANYRKALESKNEEQVKKTQQEIEYIKAKIKYLGLGYNDKHAESLARIEASEALADKRRSETGDKTSVTKKTERGDTTITETTTRHSGSGGNSGSRPWASKSSSGGKREDGRPW